MVSKREQKGRSPFGVSWESHYSGLVGNLVFHVWEFRFFVLIIHVVVGIGIGTGVGVDNVGVIVVDE